MEEIAVSKFKINCLAVVEQVRKTRQPVRITRFGKPVAELMPPALPERPKNWMGSMAGTAEIIGDIVGPVFDESEWDVLRDPDVVLDPSLRKRRK
jgi:prevent-host-death family protein